MNEASVENLSASVEEAARKREAEFQAVVKAGTNLPELLERLCPDGVEYRILGDIASTIPGLAGKTKADFVDGNVRFITYRNVFNNPSVEQRLDDYVRVGDSEKQNAISLGDVLVTGSSESREELGMTAVVTSEPREKIYLNSFCFILRFTDSSLFVPDFLKHLFRSVEMRKQIQATGAGVTRINLSKPKFLKIRVPVPPVEVQEEIVRILDLMTELEAELEAELEKRRLQYAHYRDALLSFKTLTNFERERERESLSDNWHWVTLGEVGTFIKGNGIQKSDLKETGYPAIHYGQLHTRYSISTLETISFVELDIFTKSRKAQFRDILLATTSENDDDVAKPTLWLGNMEVAVSGDATIFRPQCNSSFLVHFFMSEAFRIQKKRLISGTKVRRLSVSALAKVRLLLPPLEEQERIAGILDQMDALVNDLTSGLPAELEARRKQYAYYRDRLLTFKEKTQM